jgi:phosphatidylinositol-3-phosphatase
MLTSEPASMWSSWPMRKAAVVALMMLMASCAQSPVTAVAPVAEISVPTPAAPRAAEVPRAALPTATATPSGSPSLPEVVVIAMENTTPRDAFGAPYLASLASQALVFSNFRAVAHPSLPNYLALTSGQTWSIRDDGYRVLPAGRDLGAQLTSAEIPWRAYMEGMDRGCLDSPGPYAVKHNPFAYYGGGCPANVVPLAAFASDLAAGLPPFTWITPDLCHDGHDCGPKTSDIWLSTMVPLITGSPGWQRDGVLILVWDEGAGARPDEAPLVVLSSRGHAATVSTRSDAYSVLATIEELFGLPKLGAASDATTFTALLH